jgi:hypothetical protein
VPANSMASPTGTTKSAFAFSEQPAPVSSKPNSVAIPLEFWAVLILFVVLYALLA